MRFNHGSLINVLMDNTATPTFQIGDGATILSWSDRHPGTIIATRTSKAGVVYVTVQEDSWKRTDNNGLSESQEYEYTRNPDGPCYEFRMGKDGLWKEAKGGSYGLRIGQREKYYDFTF